MKKYYSIFFIGFILCHVAFTLRAQLPETVIYLFDMQKTTQGFQFSSPKIISKSKGYNNQPYFTPDGRFFYYVSSVDTANTEIYRIDLSQKKLRSKRITKTSEAEYSPKYTPDMEHISFVRVEKDRTTQHFYTQPLKGKKASLILPELKLLGYYDWISQNEFISFELPEPFYLLKHTIANHNQDTLATHIGRTIYYLRSKNKIIYTDKSDSTSWKIRMIAPENLKRKIHTSPVENPILATTLTNEEDYCFLMDGSILMGQAGALYMLKNPFRNNQEKWKEIFDFRKFGITKFYRLAVSPDNTKIALVVYTGKKP